jgi:dCMP deaminase
MVDGGCKRTIHAEANACMAAPTHLDGATLYCTDFPCLVCAQAIAGSGIERLVYAREYRNTDAMMTLLLAKVNIEQGLDASASA